MKVLRTLLEPFSRFAAGEVNDRASCICRGYRVEAVPVGAVDSYTIEWFPAGSVGLAAALDTLEACLSTERASYTHFVVWKVLEVPVASSPLLEKVSGEV